MLRLARAAIASIAVMAVLAALAAELADPVGDGLQTLARHRLVAEGCLLLVVAVAAAFGIAIERAMSGAAGSSATAKVAPQQVEPVKAQAPAETMSRAETEFLANMSHELRTPLNAVIGFAELVLSEAHGPLGDRRYFEYVGHIRSGGSQLLALVDAVMDLSQLAAGQLDLRPRPVEPQAIVAACAQSAAAQAAAAKVRLVMRPSTAPSIVADPDRLKQAVSNLLSNAIKFTGQGGQVTIGAAGRDGAVAFEVTDTGIGMTPAEVVVAMQPFRMIDGSMTRRHAGFGLGLPLAERLVRLHGGELRIDSRPGCGTTATAILPAGPSRQDGAGQDAGDKPRRRASEGRRLH